MSGGALQRWTSADNRWIERRLGRMDYGACWSAMRAFTRSRDAATADECWVVEHPPVYTQGMGGRPEHLLAPTDIPVIHTDRGGQITYHGPGQLVVYPLLNLTRRGLSVKSLVSGIEQGIIDCLAELGLPAHRRNGAPGVYVDDRKLASVGLRVRRGCSYHGLSLNVDPDLKAFRAIRTCGIDGLEVTSLARLGWRGNVDAAAARLVPWLARRLEPDF